jgi:hypothetical protein
LNQLKLSLKDGRHQPTSLIPTCPVLISQTLADLLTKSLTARLKRSLKQNTTKPSTLLRATYQLSAFCELNAAHSYTAGNLQ